jgi:hypothetical protein
MKLAHGRMIAAGVLNATRQTGSVTECVQNTGCVDGNRNVSCRAYRARIAGDRPALYDAAHKLPASSQSLAARRRVADSNDAAPTDPCSMRPGRSQGYRRPRFPQLLEVRYVAAEPRNSTPPSAPRPREIRAVAPTSRITRILARWPSLLFRGTDDVVHETKRTTHINMGIIAGVVKHCVDIEWLGIGKIVKMTMRACGEMRIPNTIVKRCASE